MGVMVEDRVVSAPGAGVDVAGSGLVYRPYLDGLRAVAVYLVVLFHAGSGWFSGGYVGVDVFFVLSGFLVTQLLLRDVVGSGRVRFGRFYARRFRRLLPAAFVTLLVTGVVYTAIASPAEVVGAVGSFKAAFLYSTNWYFIHQSTGYFGADISANPVLHFWSLAVEEQFYLVWPLALGGLFVVTRRLGPRQLVVIRAVVAAGAVVSVVAALVLRTSDPNRAYYGTDTRAYELLAGGLLALAPGWTVWAARYRRAARVAALVSVVGLVVLATGWVHLDAIERGIPVTVAACVLIAGLEAADGGLVRRVLSHDRLVYLGKVSYGTYLWHWLVILVALRTFHLSTITTVAISALVATALAALSFEMLERPIRFSVRLDRYRAPVIATGLAISVVSALVLIPHIVDPAHANTPTLQTTVDTTGFTKVPPNLDWRSASKGQSDNFVTCYRAPVSKCTVVRGTGKHLLLIGDSHAAMMVPAFTEIARKEHLTLSVDVRGGCPWQRNLYAIPITVGNRALRLEDCRAQKEDMYTRVIPALHPDVIVTMDLGHEDPSQLPFLGPNGQRLPNSSPAEVRWVLGKTQESVRALRATGAKLMLIEPIPVTKFDPLKCLSAAKTLQQCRYVARPTPDALEQLYRRLAQQDHNVWSVNLDRLVCPFLPICDPVVSGHIVKFDPTHLTEDFAVAIAPQIDAYMKALGVIPK